MRCFTLRGLLRRWTACPHHSSNYRGRGLLVSTRSTCLPIRVNVLPESAADDNKYPLGDWCMIPLPCFPFKRKLSARNMLQKTGRKCCKAKDSAFSSIQLMCHFNCTLIQGCVSQSSIAEGSPDHQRCVCCHNFSSDHSANGNPLFIHSPVKLRG